MAELELNIPTLKLPDGNEIPMVSALMLQLARSNTCEARIWHRDSMV